MAIKRQTRRNINQMLGKIPSTLNCAVLFLEQKILLTLTLDCVL